MSSIPVFDEVHSIQLYVIKFVSNLDGIHKKRSKKNRTFYLWYCYLLKMLIKERVQISQKYHR